MVELPHTFAHDHILRDESGLPVGRVVLRALSSYTRGDPIAVVLLTLSSFSIKKVLKRTFYVDGLPYRIPDDIPELRVKEMGGFHKVNNFYLIPVENV